MTGRPISFGCSDPIHEQSHGHDHAHHHPHHQDRGTVINIEQDILQRNNLLAERNRGYFEAKCIFCINLMSSPGSGKTTLLEETVRRLKDRLPLYVIEGDQQTSCDADRIAALHIPVFQVNTGTGCHLEANMVNHAVKHLHPQDCQHYRGRRQAFEIPPYLFGSGRMYYQ